MKSPLTSLHSMTLSYFLIALIAASVAAEHVVYVDAYQFDDHARRWQTAYNHSVALAHAIEQYCVDFPVVDPIANNRTWTERLGGLNSRGIKYLKVERIAQDAAKRLVDPDGVPYVIATESDPDFELINPQSHARGEFHVGSEGTGAGVGVGHCDSSAQLSYPRS